MACVEYECRGCGKFWSDNKLPPERRCVSCGSLNLRIAFDEERDRERGCLTEEQGWRWSDAENASRAAKDLKASEPGGWDD